MSAVSEPQSTGLPRWPLLALFAGACCIAMAPIFVRLSEVGPTATAFWRVFLPIPVLLLWTVLERRGVHSSPDNRAWRAMVLAGIAFAADLGFWHLSVKWTSVANATLLPNLMPVYMAVIGFCFLGERYSLRFLAGLALAVGGAIVLMGGSFTVKPEQLAGDVIAIGTAAFYCAYLLYVKKARQWVGTGRIMLISAIVSAVILLPVALAFGETIMPQTSYGWSVVLGLAFFTHAAGQGLIGWSLAHLPATFSAVGLLIQPVGAALIAAAMLGEPLTAWTISGGIIVLTGILMARKGS
ncbi:DMT family transporter [Lacibacterium aquatile]|uniref:DMT family transporter n=1 Tax=Lacibacterium aquatile TaxID=1168082 RepID=A0ABW5DUL9_9PROT